MLPDEMLDHLKSLGQIEKAAEAAAWHKVDRIYLGIAAAELDALARDLRQSMSLEDRLAMAEALWQSNIHEAMIVAAKLFEQARIRPDDSAVFAQICAWVPGLEGAAVSDQLAVAGAKRLLADPTRIEVIAGFQTLDNRWARRAGLMMTLPFAKMNNPKAQDLEIRERALAWAAALISDRNWFIQKAISGWIADLSRHDPERARHFVAEHGAALKSYARKESARFL